MALDRRNRFLLQTDEKGAEHLYIWTPILAQRPDTKPISFEEAQAAEKRIAKIREEKRYARYDYDPRVPGEEPEDNPVIEEALNTEADAEGIKDEALKLAKSNEDLLKDELKRLHEFPSSEALEEYFLLKYRMELTQTEDFQAMKKEAAQSLAALANANKLYEVKK